MKILVTSKDGVETCIDQGAENYRKFANDGAKDECQKRARKWYLQVRPFRDLMFHEMINIRRSRVPSTGPPVEGYCRR